MTGSSPLGVQCTRCESSLGTSNINYGQHKKLTFNGKSLTQAFFLSFEFDATQRMNRDDWRVTSAVAVYSEGRKGLLWLRLDVRHLSESDVVAVSPLLQPQFEVMMFIYK